MNTQVSINKQGQSLGGKGYATRQRLMQAADRLLKSHSPLELTAISIAKEAQTSSATFYMYFDNVKDVCYSLAQASSRDVMKVIESAGEMSLEGNFEESAVNLVKKFNAIWNTHRHILLYRNLEADRGDKRFDELRMNSYVKEVEVLSRWIQAANVDQVTYGDAFALASVLHASMERLASIDPKLVKGGIGMARYYAAQARVIAQVLVDTPKWGNLPIK